MHIPQQPWRRLASTNASTCAPTIVQGISPLLHPFAQLQLIQSWISQVPLPATSEASASIASGPTLSSSLEGFNHHAMRQLQHFKCFSKTMTWSTHPASAASLNTPAVVLLPAQLWASGVHHPSLRNACLAGKGSSPSRVEFTGSLTPASTSDATTRLLPTCGAMWVRLCRHVDSRQANGHEAAGYLTAVQN